MSIWQLYNVCPAGSEIWMKSISDFILPFLGTSSQRSW